MTYEIFVPQRERHGAPRCVLCGGKVMNGLNCTCAADAMWLYRASQGKVRTTMCKVRDLTNDCDGGTRLRQMQTVNVVTYKITKGMLYLPTKIDSIFNLIDTGRYGSHLNISYAPVVGTSLDALAGTFRANHDIYLSGPGATPSTIRVGDPAADRYKDWPKSLLKTAAGRLEIVPGTTLDEDAGGGKCYAYATPADPATPSTLYHFRIKSKTPVYNAPEVKPYRYLSSGSGACRRYTSPQGRLWFQIVKPGSPVNGDWLHAGPTIEVTPI